MNFAKLQYRASEAGITIADLIVSTAITAVISAGMLTAITTLQKSAAASQHYSESQVRQARILDYVARDLRRALSVAVDTTAGGERITVNIPDYYDTEGRPREPIIAGSGIAYGAAGASIPISYYRRAGTFYRNVNGTENALATNVDDFDADFTDSGKQTVSVKITFTPRYRFSGKEVSTLREGTAASATTLLRNKRH